MDAYAVLPNILKRALLNKKDFGQFFWQNSFPPPQRHTRPAGHLSTFEKLDALGFKGLADGFYRGGPQFFPTLKPGDCVGRYPRSLGKVSHAKPSRHPRHLALLCYQIRNLVLIYIDLIRPSQYRNHVLI